jgi:radical SAM protein with 4Fe4S-binding SPASM domain
MNPTYELLIKKLSLQAGAMNLPLNGVFELTSRCNLNCRMCYIHDQKADDSLDSRELSTDQWLRLASEARDAGMLNLLLTGGEIFLKKDFRIIYESIIRMGLNIHLYSNATLIDAETAKWLGKIPPTRMEITIYGASAETYGKLCGNMAAYSRVVNAIDMLLAEGINIDLRTTITEYNIDDYDAIAEFSYKRGIPLNIVDYLYPARSSTQLVNSCRLTPEKLIDVQKDIAETNLRLLKKYSKGTISAQSSDLVDKYAENPVKVKPDPKMAESAFVCCAGSSDFWITWDGRMLPCGALEEPAVLPLEIGFTNAWKELGMQCGNIPVCRECRNCEIRDYCLTCPAKLKFETGYYNRPAEYLCQLAQLTKNRFSVTNKEV